MASKHKFPEQSGRICAYRILASKLAEALIEDGILNRPIAYVQKKGNNTVMIFSHSGYYGPPDMLWHREHDSDEPIWTPSFIDSETWQKAVQSFHPRRYLEYNVENYLIPEMQRCTNHPNEEDLHNLVREFLLNRGVLNMPVRKISGDIYYFDDNEIYTQDKGAKLFPYEESVKFRPFVAMSYNNQNMIVWNKATTKFKPGMTLAECVTEFFETVLEPKPELSEELRYVNRIIQSISSPRYERVPENENQGTFDRIHVSVGLPCFMFQTQDELKAAVKENRSEIERRVIEKIAGDRYFKKYGVPINVIRLSNVLLRKDCSLEYIFELKQTENDVY